MESKLKKGDVLICIGNKEYPYKYTKTKEYPIKSINKHGILSIKDDNSRKDAFNIDSLYFRDYFKLKPSTPKPVKVKKYEPKVGEWYKETYRQEYGTNMWFPCLVTKTTDKVFGISIHGEFIPMVNVNKSISAIKADPKEVLFALTREAEKRGYKDGVMVKNLIGTYKMDAEMRYSDCWDENGFQYMGRYILNTKGEWAQIIEEEKPIKTQQPIPNKSVYHMQFEGLSQSYKDLEAKHAEQQNQILTYSNELEQSKQLVIDLQKQLDTATNEMLKAQSEVSKLKKLANDFYLENLQLINKDLEHKKIIMKQLNNQ